ncbi:MAG: hypothetical protein ABL921_19615 [Pirellula sp.]
MGMFNSIIANLPCSNGQAAADGMIQIKWQLPEKRSGEAYYMGDTLDGIMPEYDNVWIKTDFICEFCSRRTPARDGTSFIKVMDQQRHIIFVRIENGRIRQIISEDEFKTLNITEYATDLL